MLVGQISELGEEFKGCFGPPKLFRAATEIKKLQVLLLLLFFSLFRFEAAEDHETITTDDSLIALFHLYSANNVLLQLTELRVYLIRCLNHSFHQKTV